MNSIWSILCTLAMIASGQPRPIVFIGDSIIARMQISAPDINMGLDGDPIANIAERMKNGPASARAIFFEGGIIDIGNRLDENIIENYKLIFSRKPFLAKPYLIGILPIDESNIDASWRAVVDNRKIAVLNDQIAALCPECKRVKIMLPPGSHLPDGIHLTSAGYVALKQAIADAQQEGEARENIRNPVYGLKPK